MEPESEKQVAIEPLPEKPKKIFKKTKEVHEKTPERVEGYKKWQQAGQKKRQENKLKSQKYDELESSLMNANKKIAEYENIIQLLYTSQKEQSAQMKNEAPVSNNPEDKLTRIFSKFRKQ